MTCLDFIFFKSVQPYQNNGFLIIYIKKSPWILQFLIMHFTCTLSIFLCKGLTESFSFNNHGLFAQKLTVSDNP